MAKVRYDLVVWADATSVIHIKTDSPIQRVTVFSPLCQVISRSLSSTTLDLSSAPAGIGSGTSLDTGRVITRKLTLQ